MGKLTRINWVFYCLLIFAISRIILTYEFDLAKNIFIHKNADFFTTMCKWDCKWYLTIINDGYDLHIRTSPRVWSGLANWAFFPLYPYIVKIVVSLISSDVIITGIILNQIFILLSLLVFYKYLKLSFDETNSRFGVILLAFSPFSVYFASLYTESLFLLLSLSAFYFMRINRPYISAIFGGLLSATRPVGIMFSLVYFLYGIRKKSQPSLIWGTLISMFGLIIYMVYLHYHVGDFLAFEHIQRGWGRTGFQLTRIGSQLLKMVMDYNNSGLFVFSCIIAVWLFINKYYEEAIFNLLCILPGFMTGTMLSEGRFCGTLFTFYLGLVLISKKSNSLKIGLAVVFFVFYISYFMYWLSRAKFLI
ncbi:MAG: glycosyltransferase family 39 protein [Proteobacteria bacterium]|jgi:Gpi18-like mannosyltransferase|nr:glycosyltransferase family 39 protein [Pseudomonadota bacterium]